MVSLEPGKNQRTPQLASRRAPFLSGAVLQGMTRSHGKRAVDCHASEGTVLGSAEVSEGQGRPRCLPSRFPCVASPNTPTPHSPRAPSAPPLRHELRVGNAHHQARSSPSGPGPSAWGAPGKQGPRQEENQEPWLSNQPLGPQGWSSRSLLAVTSPEQPPPQPSGFPCLFSETSLTWQHSRNWV